MGLSHSTRHQQSDSIHRHTGHANASPPRTPPASPPTRRGSVPSSSSSSSGRPAHGSSATHGSRLGGSIPIPPEAMMDEIIRRMVMASAVQARLLAQQGQHAPTDGTDALAALPPALLQLLNQVGKAFPSLAYIPHRFGSFRPFLLRAAWGFLHHQKDAPSTFSRHCLRIKSQSCLKTRHSARAGRPGKCTHIFVYITFE